MAVDLLKKDNLWLNLGCGKDHKKGFVNCDIQKIKGVDLVMDCADLSRFRDKSVTLIFGHSFFEHLYLYQEVPFLKNCKRILKDDGLLVLLGIPDFEKICRAYLAKSPAQPEFSDSFDLLSVYRLTHGDFEDGKKASIPQLHKTLFDKKGLRGLFTFCGFQNVRIFNYNFPKENQKLSIGIVASKSGVLNKGHLKSILSEFKTYFDDLDSEIIG